MKKDIIGAILKKRIKEQGYTQEEFSEETGIALSTLKKYMSGQIAYNYEILDIIANTLNCSYDYLLGRSLSPNAEYHEITEQTRLSQEAIEKLCMCAKSYDDDNAKSFIATLDQIICDDLLIPTICTFLVANKTINTYMSGMANSTGNAFIQSINNSIFEIEYTPPIPKEIPNVSYETSLIIQITTILKDIKNNLENSILSDMTTKYTDKEHKQMYEEAIMNLNSYVKKSEPTTTAESN